jgi:hypothetical protein
MPELVVIKDIDGMWRSIEEVDYFLAIGFFGRSERYSVLLNFVFQQA